jgi:ABC-type transport system substrate-binding protein
MMAIALTAGCQSPPAAPAPTTTPASAAARRAHPPHLFPTAALSDPKTFNPLLTADATSADMLDEVFDTLVRLDPRTGAMGPALAERWEMSPDGTEVTFWLRRDVRFHDGVPLTAADVVFTFDAIYDPRVPTSYKDVLTIDGRRIAVEALDDHTVRMRLPHAFAPLLNAIAAPIVPRHRLGAALAAGTFARQWGIDTPPDRIVGSGPYKLDRYVPAQYVHWVRNPDYWMRDDAGRPLPYLPEQTMRIVPNQDTAYLKFLAGETDLHRPRPEEIPDLQAQAGARDIGVRELGLDTGTLFVSFNRNPAHYRRNGTTDPASPGSPIRTSCAPSPTASTRRRSSPTSCTATASRRAPTCRRRIRGSTIRMWWITRTTWSAPARCSTPAATSIATATACARTATGRRSRSRSIPTPATRCARRSAPSSRRTGSASA